MSSQLSETAHTFLEAKRFAVLATINRDGTPRQLVIWYELGGNVILINAR
jgi:predicted pyridoxine 5'-phosphate oxidase superfamily flavin-nucleotide-binding protein